jgi:hypothetical protein
MTVTLSAVQSILLHIQTTDFGHRYFSVYFFVEIFILLISIITGLRHKTGVLIFLLAFLFEVVWFFIYERPISPDVLIMLVVGLIRTYTFFWLFYQMANDDIFYK